jgi:hypothetical protein
MARKRNEALDDNDDVEVAVSAFESDARQSDDDVSNVDDVPLFSGVEFKDSKAVNKIRVMKLDAPGAGYKGEVPISSTLETIGGMYGDGLYKIEAVSLKGRVLRTREERISLGIGANAQTAANQAPPAANGLTPALVDKLIALASANGATATTQAREFTALVTTQTESAALREREFMQGANASQQQYFAAMAAQMQANFTQMMAMMSASHQHTLESLSATLGRRDDEGGSVERMLALFSQGLQMGRGLSSGEDDEPPFWQQIAGTGAQLLAGIQQKQLASPANGSSKRAKPAVSTKGKKVSSEARTLIQLAGALRKRGIDPATALRMVENGAYPSQPELEPDDSPDDESGEPDDDSEGDDDSESRGEPARPIFIGGGDSDADS